MVLLPKNYVCSRDPMRHTRCFAARVRQSRILLVLLVSCSARTELFTSTAQSEPSRVGAETDWAIPPSTPRQVWCGEQQTCAAPARKCCGTSCSLEETCGTKIALACDGPEDCSGGVCCAHVSPTTIASSCNGTCSGVLLCHHADQCPASTPSCCGIRVEGATVTFGHCQEGPCR